MLGNDIQKDLIVDYDINENKAQNVPSNITVKKKDNS